ncbi:MAG: hypothetical protein VCC01_06040, partial [Candidatus Hydrogenedentota bacterium]
LHDENRNFNNISADEYLRSTGSTTQSLINLKSNIKLHDFSVQLSTFRRALHYLDPHENDNASRAVFDMGLSPSSSTTASISKNTPSLMSRG